MTVCMYFVCIYTYQYNGRPQRQLKCSQTRLPLQKKILNNIYVVTFIYEISLQGMDFWRILLHGKQLHRIYVSGSFRLQPCSHRY